MDIKSIYSYFEKHSNPENVKGMQRFGIRFKKAFGVRVPLIRALAKTIKKDHALALELWKSEAHEAKLLATMIADPKQIDGKLMESWVKDFYSWDICDQCIMNLFCLHPLAWDKAVEWAGRDEEFVKRAGFAMMASLTLSYHKAVDKQYEPFFPLIKRGSADERNFVKKAVNWALRQIGKRNPALNKKAIAVSEEIVTMNSKSARWIASDALRELKSEAVQERLAKKVIR